MLSAIRGFAPVYYDDQQVGAVLVALLTNEVQQQTAKNRRHLEAGLLVGLIIGIFAVFLVFLIFPDKL